MKKSLFILGLVAVAGASNAQMLYTGGVLSENFDGINATTNPFTAVIGDQKFVPGIQFQGTKLSGTGTTALPFSANDGSGNSGSIYSYGATAAADRALGAVASGSNVAGFGVEIRNASNSPLSSITISFTQENWRSSTSVVNTVAAAWIRSGGSVTATNFLTATGMTAVTGLDLVGPAPVTTNGLLDGNLAANQAARTATLTFVTAPLAVGESIYVRWQDFNDGGNDAGLAIDNMSISAQAVPEPATMAALGIGVAALLRRRKK